MSCRQANDGKQHTGKLIGFKSFASYLHDPFFSQQTELICYFSQLVLGISLFDIVGCIAFGLSTIPVPEYNAYGETTRIYGALGNDATCKAQGFLIQLNFTALFYNISLSTYYLLGKPAMLWSKVPKCDIQQHDSPWTFWFHSYCTSMERSPIQAESLVAACRATDDWFWSCFRRNPILPKYVLWYVSEKVPTNEYDHQTDALTLMNTIS